MSDESSSDEFIGDTGDARQRSASGVPDGTPRAREPRTRLATSGSISSRNGVRAAFLPFCFLCRVRVCVR